MAGAFAEAESRWPGLHTAASGDLLLEDIRAWRKAQCARVGWDILTPLFGVDTAQLARELISEGLRAALCCVDNNPTAAIFVCHDFAAALPDAPTVIAAPTREYGEFHTVD